MALLEHLSARDLVEYTPQPIDQTDMEVSAESLLCFVDSKFDGGTAARARSAATSQRPAQISTPAAHLTSFVSTRATTTSESHRILL